MTAATPQERFESDLHVHSEWSFDSKSPVERILARARERGLRTVAITDHCFRRGEDLERLLRRQEPARNARQDGIDVLLGVELSFEERWIVPAIEAGAFDFLDIRIGAVHGFAPERLYPSTGARGTYDEYAAALRAFAERNGQADLIGRYVKETLEALSTGSIDVLTHPWDIFLVGRMIVDRMLDASRELVQCAVENRVAIEVNNGTFANLARTSSAAHYDECVAFYQAFYALCKREGAGLSGGSDAHYVEDVGEFSRATEHFGLGMLRTVNEAPNLTRSRNQRR